MDEWSWNPDPADGIVMRMVEVDGRRFEVATAGEGDRLALCLHGFPELNYSWRRQIPCLRQLGYRVWAPNLRGYGRSARPSGVAAYASAGLLADIAGLIDAAAAREVLLIGHHWGGALAWLFAMRRIRPLHRLVLMNAPHPLGFAREMRGWAQRRRSWYMFFFQLPWLPERWLAARGARRIRQALDQSTARPGVFSDADLQIYAAAAAPGALTAMPHWYRAAFRQRGATEVALRRLPPIDTPTLLIWGERDHALGIDNLRGLDEHVSSLRIERLAEAAHWVQQEAPQRVNQLLRDWLASDLA